MEHPKRTPGLPPSTEMQNEHTGTARSCLLPPGSWARLKRAGTKAAGTEPLCPPPQIHRQSPNPQAVVGGGAVRGDEVTRGEPSEWDQGAFARRRERDDFCLRGGDPGR